MSKPSLYCIWRHDPYTVLKVDGESVEEEIILPPVKWPWGPIKGGTNPLPYKGKLLRFAHSTLDNEPPPRPRRYYLLAMLMQPEPPFAVEQLSKSPIVRGSETDELPDLERRSVLQYKAQVIFPGGCIQVGNEFLVACGINDSQCAILRLTEEHLKL